MAYNVVQNQVLPPTQSPITNVNNMLTDVWLRYFNNLYQQIIALLQTGAQVPSLTTLQRDSDSTLKQQRWIFNTTTNELQIYLMGAWQKVAFTPA